MTALHYSESLTRDIQRAAATWDEINAARVAEGTATYDGLIVGGALNVASEVTPELLVDKIDALIYVLESARTQVWELIDEDDEDEADEPLPFDEE